MLKNSSLKELKERKNLLAFSAGGDSTALFFLLLQHNITFDIAIVDYNLRAQSKDEVSYAQALAKRYNLQCHLLSVEPISTNMEANARELRYNFFHQLIESYNYSNLLTAHHLGDRFEWMLMQFCKGAGCVELSGMQELQKRKNYTLLRPLLHLDKEELLAYLHSKDIEYFEDASNLDESIKRNNFRHNYATPLLKEFKSGIKRSFEYIESDVKNLVKEVTIESIDEFAYFKSSGSRRSDIVAIDRYIKSLGHIITSSEKELLNREKSSILGRKYLVGFESNFVFISPYKKSSISLTKEFKEVCRVLKIEPKLRAYLAKHPKAFERVKELLRSV